ncbi:MAG: hypothetical protein JNG89_08545 [Planctomycetaceae bacterium]|nr:hypothetical protein [Planctomycetaceae bacterium]
MSLTLVVCLFAAGCQMPGAPWQSTVPAANPLGVWAGNDDVLWERTVDVLHDYQFQIVREDRLARVIETEYKVGSGCLEPWHHDSVGPYNRLESTLQSVRRRIRITLLPSDGGSRYAVSVEAFKEREDLPGIAANSAGAATFSESTPLKRDLNPVVGQSKPSRWIPVGRDLDLEQALLHSLRAAYTG